MINHPFFCHVQKLFSLASDPPSSVSLEYLTGQGKVIEPIYPHQSGRISLYGVLWPARWAGIEGYWLPSGMPVAIVKRTGVTLWVSPLEQPVISVHPVFSTPIHRPVRVAIAVSDDCSAA